MRTGRREHQQHGLLVFQRTVPAFPNCPCSTCCAEPGVHLSSLLGNCGAKRAGARRTAGKFNRHIIMRLPLKPSSADQQASAIESKRNLLAYLRSEPKRLTIESYLCLTRILSAAGWRYEQECWHNGEHHLPALEAAFVELERQIVADRDRLLRQTVGNYV